MDNEQTSIKVRTSFGQSIDCIKFNFTLSDTEQNNKKEINQFNIPVTQEYLWSIYDLVGLFKIDRSAILKLLKKLNIQTQKMVTENSRHQSVSAITKNQVQQIINYRASRGNILNKKRRDGFCAIPSKFEGE